MKPQKGGRHPDARPIFTTWYAAGAAALFCIGASAWAANDSDTPYPVGTLNPDGSNTYNAEWLGHNDLQGRVTYQTTVHTQKAGVIAYAGHFNGLMMNPMTGLVERNGTSVVDVTDPRHPVYLKHIPADKGGARMVKLCEGDVLPHGTKGHTYLLRENGAVSHEVWDVTDPANPSLMSTPITGLSVTHRNWWDCSTGIAYIVGGATKPSDASYDHWNNASSPNQHLKIFDLSNPASPKYIMDFGYPGQNPGSTFVIPGTENTTRTVPPGVHGPIVVSTFRGVAVNRLYMPYGVGSDGIFQINDLTKVLPPPYGTGVYKNPFKPTDAELLQSQIGVIYMPGVEGGHSSMPYYGIKLKQYANFTNNNVRDILALSSEETDNRCTGSPHLLYLLDITATVGQGGSTSAEQHPWPISTVTVDDFSGRPNFCSRGTRFGVHSMAENFNDPYYGRLMTSAWFDAGIRVTDIRDPYHPTEVAHFIAPVNSFTQPSSATINGVTYTSLDVSCDNTDVDDRGLLYCGDRVGGGLDIVKLAGKALEIGLARERERD
ncbi:MAG TPA: hypothetical protein VH183_03125 [Burkholderiaceae bacterium]|jgi:hypothetical protein|nr:hypothetical protein [Burkholderiaceae bacterium]